MNTATHPSSRVATLDKGSAGTRQLPPRVAFYVLGSITVSFLAGSLAPTSLYPVYQAQWGLSALTITEIFCIYAIALLGSLLIAGRLSDHLGRRPVLIVATLVQAITMMIFATADGPGSLMLARVVQGLATGAALGAVGAGLIDLDKARGPMANAIAPLIGTATGGILAGLMVHYLPAPTWLVFALLAVVFLVQSAGVLFMAEPVTPRPGAIASLKPQIGLPGSVRTRALLAVPILVAIWSLAGFYASLGPAVMRAEFAWNPSLAGGMAVFALAGSGAVSVLLFQRSEAWLMMRFGAAAVLLGTGVLGAALLEQSSLGFILGTVLAGAGFGAGFQGAVRAIVPSVKPHERASVLSVIFVVSYLAMGVPAVIAGLLVAHGANLQATAQQFAGVVALLAALALLGSLIRGRD